MASKSKTIFLDANLLYSGSVPNSAIRTLLVALHQKGHRLVASPYVIDEAQRNVSKKMPEFTEELEKVLSAIEIVRDAPLFHKVMLAESDKQVLASALASAADYLVTGNHRDFGSLYNTKISGTKIVTVAKLTTLLLKPRR